MKRVWKKVRRFFASPVRSEWAASVRGEERATQITGVIVRIFYVFLLFFAMTRISVWQQYQTLEPVDPLWPVWWLNAVDAQAGARVILTGGFVAAVLGAFFCEHRWARVAVFLGLLEYLGLKYSFGRIYHSMHLALTFSFLFIFLPRHWARPGAADRLTRQMTLRVFWCCQAFILMAYSMAGLGKIGGAIYQMFMGQIHALHPQALALHAAERLLQTNSSSLLGEWVIEHPLWGWPLMVGMMYIQFFSIWAAFRPSLHKLWGIGLILFHIGNSLILNINFHANIFLIAVFLLYSPFQSERFSWRRAAIDLPLFGAMLRRFF